MVWLTGTRRWPHQGALGAQDQFAELAGGTFAAAGRVTPWACSRTKRGIGHRHAQADAADHRQVGQVVTQVGDLLIA
jgi:hypothetical protein